MDEIRYQVFVSSTFRDLKDERDKVLQAILQLRAFPAGMELFPAADEDQFEFIKREIESSDYYVVIIAGKYGSLGEDGLSFTEKEYDYARSIGKPVLAFIVNDIDQLIGEKLERSENLRAQLLAFTEKAKKGKLVRFYSNPDQLKAEVLHSLPSQFNLKPMRGWVRSGQTSRDILEKISSLQQRVIDLESENRRLAEAQRGAKHDLSQGLEPITWIVNFIDVKLNDQIPPAFQFEVTTTWDMLFIRIFSGDRSDVEQADVRRTIGLILLDLSPHDKVPDIWRTELQRNIKVNKWNVTWHSVLQIAKDVHRQFRGLGLIEDLTENRYVQETFADNLVPRTVRSWRLTQKGAEHLALISGYRRAGPQSEA